MPTSCDEEGMVGRVYLTREEEDQLVDRLYTQSLSHKETTLAELESRYYPVAAPNILSEEELRRSVKRQVEDEMEQRRQRQADIDAAAAAAATGYANRREATTATSGKKKISHEAVDASVRRLYDEALERKRASTAENEKRYTFHPENVKSKKMSKEEFQASVERMSKPKKTVYTTAEINKIYGL